MQVHLGCASGLQKRTRFRVVAGLAVPVLLVTVFFAFNYNGPRHLELLDDDSDASLQLTDPITVRDGVSGALDQHDRTDADLMLTDRSVHSILSTDASAAKPQPCGEDCDKSPVSQSSTYTGLIYDKDSAYDTWNGAASKLGDLIPDDPTWDDYPDNLVLDPTSDKGELSSALNVKLYDPLDNADERTDDSEDGRLFRTSMSQVTGCEPNDKECIDLFIFQERRKALAWGKKHSQKWWFWSKAGRKVWTQCKVAGRRSAYWEKNKCESRGKPAKFSKWWWYTKTGKALWEECKNKGEISSFWNENQCSVARERNEKYLKAKAFGFMYSHKWWFWTPAGRTLWSQCQSEGKGTKFWRSNKCGTRLLPPLEKYSTWWWFTTQGRALFKQCMKQKRDLKFWTKNQCETGRIMYDKDRDFRRLEAWGPRFSETWWRWSSDGAKLWAGCRKAGRGTAFWRDNSCDTRKSYGRYAQWWWFSSSGRKVWRQCRKNGVESPFWSKYECQNGQLMYRKHRDALRIRDRQSLHLAAPDGRPWSIDGKALRLTGGTTLRLETFSSSSVYNNKFGRVAILQEGELSKAVRNVNGNLIIEPFVAENPDFAWQLYTSDDGVDIFTDWGGGRYVGYDDGQDQLVAVKVDDPRKVTWTIDPQPPAEDAKPPPPRYFSGCNPSDPIPDPTQFNVCVFRSTAAMGDIPTFGLSDTGANGLYYVGKGKTPIIDLHDLGGFRSIVSQTPDANYAWTIYGQLKIKEAGTYTVCTESDDGSRLYVDGAPLADDDGLHGMVEKCGSVTLTSGPHVVYVEGFQAGGGVGQVIRYSGPDTGGWKTKLRAGVVPMLVSLPGGNAWHNNGNTVRLNSGGLLSIFIYDGSDVYNSKYGRVGLFQNGDRNLAIRHSGYVLYTHPFAANNYDFAWQFYSTENGFRIFNDFGGGHFIGYDAPSDQVLIVKRDDPRVVTWNINPAPAAKYVQALPSRYYSKCDPTAPIDDPKKFNVCIFRSDVGMSFIPSLNLADTGANSLFYVGKGQLPVIDVHDLGGFRQAVAQTPDANYAWAIWGQLKIQTAGTYSVCVESDDGSRLYVDTKYLVSNDGLHGMVEQCGSLSLSAGDHVVYVEGFQAGGGVGQVIRYSGPDTGGSRTVIRAGVIPLTISLPGGNAWHNHGSMVRLNSGSTLNIFIYDGADVYNRKYGRVGLFQNGDRNLAVRHSGYYLYTHPFAANNYDFAWQLYSTDDGGFQIYNDFAGGYWIGYDAPSDRLLIVKRDDPRKVTWKINPAPVGDFVKPLPSRYYSKCDPTGPLDDVKKFSVCIFRSEVGMGETPSLNFADTGANALYYVGKGQLPVIDVHDLGGFRQAVAQTPDANYAWAIWGQLKIQIAGTYSLCIESDDGSKLYVDGTILVTNDGLHGMVDRCDSRTLSAGAHVVYVEGFQAGGGVGMVIRFAGPDTGGDKVLMRSGVVAENPHIFAQCNPFDQPADASQFTLCMFRSEVWLGSVPLFGRADTGENRVYFIGKAQIPVVDMHSIQAFRQYVPNIPDSNYGWAIMGKLKVGTAGSYTVCISSDDGSKLYLDGIFLVNDDGLHGMVERCGTSTLSAGDHVIYVEGFQCGGGVGQELTYQGPDTSNQRVFLRSGSVGSVSVAPAGKYYPLCDPTAPQADATAFTMCIFRSEVQITSVPNVAAADAGRSRLYYVGKAKLPIIAFYSIGQLRQYVPETPDANYAWAIYGQLKITTAGSYNLCITSDDGSRLSVDGVVTVNDDGLHGMYEQCTSATLTQGDHTIYLEGFQCGGGVGQEAKYSGPDTGNQKVFMLSGTPSSQYYPKCDPNDPSTAGEDKTKFTICTFRTNGGYYYMPRLGDAVASKSITYLGKGQIPLVDLHTGAAFRQYVPATPDENFAWSIWGKLQVANAGSYTLCITSDDGSMLYLDKDFFINDDGLHGMSRRCSSRYLTQGDHLVYLEGFQGGGGVGQELTYSGPDTQWQEIYMGAGGPPPKAGQGKDGKTSQYYPDCDPTKQTEWSKFTLCMFRSEVFNWYLPDISKADNGRSRLYYVGKAQIDVVDMHQVSGFRQYIPHTPEVNYAWVVYGQLKIQNAGTYHLCISSDDGSKLYVDGPLLVNDDGLHGMVERCGAKHLTQGDHVVYLEGFQGGGGVGQELTYQGPDTAHQRIFVRSGVVGTTSPPSPTYSPYCDPTGKKESTSFTMCVFRSEVWLGSIPTIGLADTGKNRLYYIGQGTIPQVAFYDLGKVRSVVPQTPDSQYAWAIYGQLKIATAGTYSLCISSDDGSKLYVDGALLVNIDGLHGMYEQCANRQLEAGAHLVYIEGFQCGGGVGQEAKYSGPDTGNQKVFMLSGTPSSQYYPKCDPTSQSAAPAEPGRFAVCMFTAWPGISSLPRVGDAAAVGLLKLIGRGSLPVVDMHTGEAFRQYVAGTPNDNIVWVMYGSVQVAAPGAYEFCISSDDGSKLYVDGPLLVNDDGLHGMYERCNSVALQAGPHTIYLEGFQAGGGLGQELRYSGPDTGGRRVFLRAGAPLPKAGLAAAAKAATLKAVSGRVTNLAAAAGGKGAAAGGKAAGKGAAAASATAGLGPEELAEYEEYKMKHPHAVGRPTVTVKGDAAEASAGSTAAAAAAGPLGDMKLPSLQRMAASAVARPGILDLIDGVRQRLAAARAAAPGDSDADAAAGADPANGTAAAEGDEGGAADAGARGPRPTLPALPRVRRGRGAAAATPFVQSPVA